MIWIISISAISALVLARHAIASIEGQLVDVETQLMIANHTLNRISNALAAEVLK